MNIDEIIERATKTMQEMEGKDLADLCNREFGMNLKYLEDGEFEEITDAFTELKVGLKVLCLTGMYAPRLSEGAVGTISYIAPYANHYVVDFSDNRQYIFRADQIKLATEDEIAEDKADPDLDEKAKRLPQFYDCGICGHWHPIEWNGDCREYANRFSTSYLEDKYGQEGEGWEEVPMPGGEDIAIW